MKANPSKRKLYYPVTTSSQRTQLFSLWKSGDTIAEASRKVHVSIGTFYYWKPRFEARGFEALIKPEKSGPKLPANKTSPSITSRILIMKEKNPIWGRQRIADQLMKENDWVAVVSASTVGNILKLGGYQSDVKPKEHSKLKQQVAHAEKPNQTINIDMCFIPNTHNSPDTELPMVSGSSGKLKLCKKSKSQQKLTWSGDVFNDPDLNYTQAMDIYTARKNSPKEKKEQDDIESLNISQHEQHKIAKRKLNKEEEVLRVKRSKLRNKRNKEDEKYRREKKRYSNAKKNRLKDKTLNKKKLKQAKKIWNVQREEQQKKKAKRKEEDAKWRKQRNSINRRKKHLPDLSTWVAILVIVDNYSRKCIELPLFMEGTHTTAEQVANQLKIILPSILQYLISDRGIHFKCQKLAALATEIGFKQVLVGPYRPQTNGIAERFVRTLKEWLADKTWTTEQELIILLAKFRSEYNERPHQGRELKGLSPNEYQKRNAG